MPRIFRSMLADGAKPRVGFESKMLGVRIAPNSHADIAVDENGNVHPNTGGMSVVPEWRKLPWHLIPKRLDKRGRGPVGLICWRLGTGDFKDDRINEALMLRVDPNSPGKHGFVEPGRVMTIAEYQAALAATQDEWIRDES